MRSSLLGLLGAVIGIYIGVLSVFSIKNDINIQQVRNLSNEQIQTLSPSLRTRLLRALETNQEDSLLFLNKEIKHFRQDQKKLLEIQVGLKTLDSLIKAKEYKRSLEFIITLKGMVNSLKTVDKEVLQKQLDSLRVEYYKAAQQN